jgi:hypothetical protein
VRVGPCAEVLWPQTKQSGCRHPRLVRRFRLRAPRAYEFDRGAWLRPLASARQHRRGNVNAQHPSGRTSALGERDRAGSGTAANIDHTFARTRPRSLQRCLQDRAQDDVTEILACDPTAAASAIFVGDFSFILWVVQGFVGSLLTTRLGIQNDNVSGFAVRDRDPPIGDFFPKKPKTI